MNYTKLLFSCTALAILLSLAGCAKRSHYKPRQLKSLKEFAQVDYQETKEQVTVRAKAFTADDCDRVFAEHAERITGGKNPLQPIQLCIENNSSTVWELHDSNVDLPMVPIKNIAEKISAYNFIHSAICGGIGIIGLLAGITINIVAQPVGGACLLTLAIMELGGCVIISTPFVFLIDYCGTYAENSEIAKFIHQTHIDKTVAIPPSKTIDLLLFVEEKKYQPQFKLTLVNTDKQSKKKLPFIIKIHEQDA